MSTSAPVLSSSERKALRRLAHDLSPVVQIAEAGLSDGVIAAVEQALEDHELIKVKIYHEREERTRLAEEAANRTGSGLAGTVGRMAILYRPAADPGRRRIVLD